MNRLLDLQDLVVHFKVNKGNKPYLVQAVDGVSFTVDRGETLGLVGESGCGKTTVGRAIAGFTEVKSGKIIFDGTELGPLTIKSVRSRMQMVFQDPYSSLDPRMTVNDIVGEPLDIQFPRMDRKERNGLILEKMRLVGLNAEHLSRFPHEFSGGQRQRISIARAMVTQLDFLICDEPVSALDISIQAQIINMLMDLQEQFGLAYLFIAHDLSVVRHISRRVAVMYLGHIMEHNTAEDLYAHPLHPYTLALLSAIPVPDPRISRSRRRIVLKGDVPSPINPPSGCVFRTRCPYAQEICQEEVPRPEDIGAGHIVACHRFREIA
ncbi:MAG: ATP-binding cassette domain-containing protein [Treponema sp.]|jgi:oligopeptide transport system ATP-binding protein|nr:ATP-binding cassette domain-containing protein [Treponema sp.]